MIGLVLLIGCGGAPFERSPPPPPPTEPLRFVAVGDIGRVTDAQRAVARAIEQVCAERGCAFGLLLGDNLYPSGMDSDDDPRMNEVFTEAFGEVGITFMAVLGNHDCARADPFRPRRQIRFAQRTPSFEMPDPYYRFQRGDAEFFALDTDPVFFYGEETLGAWLDERLPRSTARWRIAFGHHPYRSNGTHGNAGAYEGWSNVPWLSGNALRRLFERHVQPHADLYLAGHDHNLQVLCHRGLPLVVSGAGHATRPLVDRGNRLDLGFDVPGFAWIELYTSLTVVLYDERGTRLGEHRYAHPRETRSRCASP